MAQDIRLMGADWLAVPSVDLKKTTSGYARFTDASVTTAVESDVTSGKIFIKADGSQATGTNSGGGGSVPYVTGTFTTGSSAGVESLTIDYSGTGYPIMCVVVIDGGAYASGTEWYTLIQRYAVGQWTMTKSNMTIAPTYTTSGSANQGVTTYIYKSSTSSSTSYSRSSAMSTNAFSSSNAANSGATCVRFKGNKTLSYYVNTSSYGLCPDMTYRYFIVYSA